MDEIIQTCEYCKYELEEMEGPHCRHCIHNARENFEPKEKENDNSIIDEFANTLKGRLTDAIHQKDVESMTNLINDVAREVKAGNNKCYARACNHNNIDNTCMYGNASERRCRVKAN